MQCLIETRNPRSDLSSKSLFLLNLVSVPYQFFQFYWIPTESLNQFNFIFFHFYWIRFQLVFSFFQFGWISTELYFKFVLHLFSFFFNSTEFWLKGDSFGIQFFSFLLKIYWALKLQFKFSANSVLLNLNWSQFSRHSVFFSSTEILLIWLQ